MLRAYFLAALDGNDLLYVARIAFSNMLLLSWLRQPNDMHPLTLAQAKPFFMSCSELVTIFHLSSGLFPTHESRIMASNERR